MLTADIESELPRWLTEHGIETGATFHADDRRAVVQRLEFMPMAHTIKATRNRSFSTGDVEVSPFHVKTLSLTEEQPTLTRFGGM
jgi:hypothetical protein